ncbi:MAG: glycoside hydrolase family 78 protein [Clostridiales bacterium]|nr:glycoside hydrolase family 78 protein [Clostridiales bacterium]
MEWKANWICPAEDMKDICPVFLKSWSIKKEIKHAELRLTALGIYEANLNGQRVSKYVLAPGWTTYDKRLQVQRYDITNLIRKDKENILTITVGKGWFRSPMPGWVESLDKNRRKEQPCGIIAELRMTDTEGSTEIIVTDKDWQYGESAVRFSEIYDGEIFDARFETKRWNPAAILNWPKDILIEQEGEEIREQERVSPKSIFITPAGETIVDFGQEVTGYVELSLCANAGEIIRFQHGEMLNRSGNFYRDNYRNAKAEVIYICRDGVQTWHPSLTFFGFRYLKLLDFPGTARTEQFTAIAVYSDIRQTGHIRSADAGLNRLISNIFWSQRDNFLDVPTDCPQRDERLGWTGDAQVFVKAASYNFDVEHFFTKWLHDLAADQRPDGGVSQVIPDYMPETEPSAAWGDAAVICPWQMYLTYGNKKILEAQFDSMKKWVDYITEVTHDKNLWTGGNHFGDWLGLDAPPGSYKGSSREDFIATAFYAHSTELLVKAGRVLGKPLPGYKELYCNILKAFRERYPEYYTQTEYVLAIYFKLTEHLQEAADALARMIEIDGIQMRTGFVGTPYLLYVLSDYGYDALAYKLLLRKEPPSWLYSVSMGATTIWEHWDGIMENGDFWSEDMNSFNHYAYGSVIDWIYEKAAGIQTIENYPGFAKVRIMPHPNRRIPWLETSLETRHGLVNSKWSCQEDIIRYEITVQMPAQIVIDGQTHEVGPGSYLFWSHQKKPEAF